MATTEVNGEICLNPAYDVSEKDIVKYDGRRINIINKTVVVMLNKPKKVITTVKDTHNRRIVMDYIPKNIRLTPIGRLYQNTTGMLLFTNDGDLQQFLTHPKNNIPKEYEAIIEGRLTTLQKEKLRKGFILDLKNLEKLRL